MASRILHRLRHALAGTGDQAGLAEGCSGAEDFPESSELEDDTEGLATRLSGTLSFTSSEEEEECKEAGREGAREKPEGRLHLELPGDPAEDGAAHGSPLKEHQDSHRLTRQLQELWRKSRGSFLAQHLLFEGTGVVSEQNSKYVLYTVCLIRAGQFDKRPTALARCCSNFQWLNRRLRPTSAQTWRASFSWKQLWHNFTLAAVAKHLGGFRATCPPCQRFTVSWDPSS